MAFYGYSYEIGRWVVKVNDKIIGQFYRQRDAINCANDYNELHEI